jgi:phosphatidylinositol kinase/protein kinase (PI-3  family)
VLLSLQCPRKIPLVGIDGNPYALLLKAKDERAMQSFGLVNEIHHESKSQTCSVTSSLRLI